mmetsp:Transcript_46108/g.113121  ORF Transcript_46108/g.113121 Transcript_46108/m.113121 type:complete len:213 (+) Transcript_46108:173-811(+)
MSCMSPYSMPLCTILTKWPAPPPPTHSQHGEPSSTLAAIDCRMGLTSGHADSEPPGMRLGPLSAPSSPPLTPQPMKRRPRASSASMRRCESENCELPPSITTSPSSSSGAIWSMNLSTTGPAFTISITLRGFLSAFTTSSTLRHATNFLSLPRPSTNASTFDVVRLYTATVLPRDSMFSAKFSPITAKPTTQMSAVAMVSVVSSAARFMQQR